MVGVQISVIISGRRSMSVVNWEKRIRVETVSKFRISEWALDQFVIWHKLYNCIFIMSCRTSRIERRSTERTAWLSFEPLINTMRMISMQTNRQYLNLVTIFKHSQTYCALLFFKFSHITIPNYWFMQDHGDAVNHLCLISPEHQVLLCCYCGNNACRGG